MVLAGWSFDEKRFREEVVRPFEQGWVPSKNLFRFYQLPMDVGDPDTIKAATSAVVACLHRNANAGWARVLLTVHESSRENILDDRKRASHRSLVEADRSAFQKRLGEQLTDLPEIPPAAVESLASRFSRYSKREIGEMLQELGRPIRVPVPLPATARLPDVWNEIRNALAVLGFQTLRSYLYDRVEKAVLPSLANLEAKKRELRKSPRGDALTAESKIVTSATMWIRDDTLRQALRAELVVGLMATAQDGWSAVQAAARAADVVRSLKDLGLPSAGELAYSVYCEYLYPAPKGGPAWRTMYDELRASRDLRGALEILNSEEAQLPADLSRQRAELKALNAKLDGDLQRAKRLESSDVEAAAELYIDVKRSRPDSEVDAGLRRCSPSPPPTAAAAAETDRVIVSWPRSAARAGEITYRVVRSDERRPAGSDSGKVIADGTTMLEAVDDEPRAGILMYYGVFTLRDGIPSTQAAAAPPVAIAREVIDLNVRGGEDVIEGNWRLPEKAIAVRVTRTESDPATRPAGRLPEVVVPTIGSTSFRDTNIRSGVTYDYRVVAEYRMSDRSVLTSAGQIATASTQELPRPVLDFSCDVAGNTLSLSWTPPPGGSVKIRVVDQPLNLSPGQVVDASRIDRLGVPLSADRPTAGGRLEARAPSDGQRHWLVPVTVLASLAAIGNPVELNLSLPPISDLRAERLGTAVRLTWEWPAHAGDVRVAWKQGSRPTGPEDPDAQFVSVGHAVYRQRPVDVEVPGGDYWFLVCTTAYSDGKRAFGPPSSVQASVTSEARYEVQHVGLRWKNRYRLAVTFANGSRPSGVRLVARHRVAPTEPEEGTEVIACEAPGDGSSLLTGTFDLTISARPLYLRAFPAAGEESRLALIPVNPSQLRID
jgi:hypothetical protein